MNETETEQQYVRPHVSLWIRLKFRGIAFFFPSVLRLIYGLFLLLKWLFAPIAMVFDMLVIMPIAKITMSIKSTLAFSSIEPDLLPNTVWRYLEETRIRFEQLGFETGCYISCADAVPSQTIYSLTMANRADHMAVGIIYIKMDKAKDPALDIEGCEFSCVHDGKFMDVSNNTSLEPFLPMPGRLRIFLPYYSSVELYYLARRMMTALKCSCNDKMLELMMSNPELLMNDEVRMMYGANIQRGLMYLDKQQGRIKLTWKGAVVSAWQTLWPTSEFYRKKLQTNAEDLMRHVGINPEQAAYETSDYTHEFKYEGVIENVADALAHAQPQVMRMGMQSMPYSISLLVTYTNGVMTIDTVELSYQQIHDHDARKMKTRIAMMLQFVPATQTGSFQENDIDLFDYDEFDNYQFEEHELLPENLTDSLNFETVIERINGYLGVPAGELYDMVYTFQIQAARAVWNTVYYSDDGEISIDIDPFSGELISKNMNAG